MTGQECIKGRRSIRKFANTPVDHDILNQIVETASYAPSWKHTQIVRYIAVDNPIILSKIATDCTSAYPNNGNIIAEAPMLIALTCIKGRSGYERDGSFTTHRNETWQMFDAGAAAEAFCLAAYEQGLGTVILGIFDEEEIVDLLSIPENQELIALIPIGYPEESPVAPRRKPVEELVTYI